MTTPNNKAIKHLLFVCVENSCRSQMAEAFAKIHGSDFVKAYSAGSHPSGIINLDAIKVMQEVGYDLLHHQSKSLNDLPNVKFDAVITMGCGDACPIVKAKIHEDWKIPDPKSMPLEEFRNVRNLIEAMVKKLLNCLTS